MRLQLPVFSVLVSFNQHYEAHWLVRAASVREARRVVLQATRRNRGILKDLKWYRGSYHRPSGYTLAKARMRVWREKNVEKEWGITTRITAKPYLACTGT